MTSHTLFNQPKISLVHAKPIILQITYMHIVPPLALFLAKEPRVDNYNLSSLKTLVSGAAPLGPEITSHVEDKLGVDFIQGTYM